MLDFKILELKDKELFEEYLNASQLHLSTYSFPNLFMWRNINDIRFAIYEGSLIVLKKDFEGSSHFIEPLKLDIEKFDTIINLLFNYAIENHFSYFFKDVSWNFAWRVKKLYCNRVILLEDRSSFDYIYKTSDLLELKGNKYKSHRNHYNHFINNEIYEALEICDSNTDECAEWLRNWKSPSGSITLVQEKKAVYELLNNYCSLNLKGIAVYVKNNLEGFSIGESIRGDTAIIHVEKANSKINGLYAYINKMLLEAYFSSLAFVNREEDLGISGLKKAKISYCPVWLEPSYSIMLNMECPS